MKGKDEIYKEIIKMSYAFFSMNSCTPGSLKEFIDLMETKIKKCGISYDQLYSDLEHLHNVTILDSSAILEDHSDHMDWFNPSLNSGLKRKIEWHFWSDFENYLSAGKNWPKAIVDSIDKETSEILTRLEDPLRDGEWDRRGMVMGGVQSGKTANYTGLISKAIDAGYKLIVVLTGVHNSLRSQTQYRLNEEILGYDLDKVQEFKGQARSIGVRAMFKKHPIAQTLTSSNEGGDFKKRIAEQAGLIPDPQGPAIIMVIKKHVSILKYLIDWATSIIGLPDDMGRCVVSDVPLLVIDDECDYASVNTKRVIRDENGVILEDCDPAKTNKRIRELLSSFRKSAYVGYTATPFANIFIHHEHKHPLYGEDLFPRNFIISLPQPSNYIGPERVFGLYENPTIGIKGKEPLPLLREINDSEQIIPGRHKTDLNIAELPSSLKEAIKVFLIVCAVRRIRKSLPPHDSLLIHVTRYTRVQKEVYNLVEREFRSYVDRILNKYDPLDDFQEIWKNDFIETSKKMKDDFSCPSHAWKNVLENLYPVARRIRIKMINGSAKDSLDYRYAEMVSKQRKDKGEDIPWEELGEHVIAIGGDKLSRGLTLDGLTISYYLRASRMYDTLMQMGRWFGYHDGYEDLCRIYTTPELMEWYRFIATASLELKNELEYMTLIGEEPQTYGLKVLSHPGQLAITSAGKSRNTQRIDLSYSGRVNESVGFNLDHSSRNCASMKKLCRSLQNDPTAKMSIKRNSFLWTGVNPELVLEFLNDYSSPKSAYVADPRKIAMFINEQLKFGDDDLVTWDVAFISRKEPPRTFIIGNIEIGCVIRNSPFPIRGNHLTIKRLLSQVDEWIDFSEDEEISARKEWIQLREKKGLGPPGRNEMPSGPAIRAARPKQRGLLLIYVLCSNEKNNPYGMKEGQEIIGFGVSFPASTSTKQVSYEVDSVYQDAED